MRDDFGYLWASLAHDPLPMFEIPEAHEPDRRTLNAVSVGIETSPPRAVENVLDLGHFPFVHPGTLGAEPHTEVREYSVDTVRQGHHQHRLRGAPARESGYVFDIEAVRAGAHRLFRVLDEHVWFGELAGDPWVVAGTHPTIADLAIFPDVILSEEGGVSRLDYPALRRWTDRVKRIPGFVAMPGIFATTAPPLTL